MTTTTSSTATFETGSNSSASSIDSQFQSDAADAFQQYARILYEHTRRQMDSSFGSDKDSEESTSWQGRGSMSQQERHNSSSSAAAVA